MLELTSEQLESYIGGHLEIQNQLEDYLYRGKIDAAYIKPDPQVADQLAGMGVPTGELVVMFSRLFKRPRTKRARHEKNLGWVEQHDSKDKTYAVSLAIMSSPTMMPHARDGAELMMVLVSNVTQEVLAFHHPDGESVRNMEEHWGA
jgi:hypothetical protein